MSVGELKSQSLAQLRESQSVLKLDLLRHVGTVAAGSSDSRKRRVMRKNLARVMTAINYRLLCD